jgi:uncharacterized protein YcfJ
MMTKKIPTVTPRIHPLMAGAAISVTVLSLVGTAAIAGWLPNSGATAAAPVSAPVPANVAAVQAPTPPEAAVPAPALAPQPAAQATAAAPHYQRVSHQEAPAPRAHQAPAMATEAAPQAPQPVKQAAAHGPNYVGIGTGAVIGGLLGNQVGHGNGRKLATLAGMIGGGLVGNEVQERQRQQDAPNR